ncbi:MAG: DNA primase [Parcubacteria group bacterium LiPW_30]|nr:MAG: DNA primase [Parcubacteria group bacterium LiPW_30]
MKLNIMSTTPVEQIKERLSITDVALSYIKLEKAGSNYKARCPFHNERTPSFFISPARGTYHCFGCNRGGDIFSFVEEIEGVDFASALKTLADKAGVELRAVDPKLKSEYERLYSVLEEATRFFENSLGANPSAKEYLAKRGLNVGTIADWRLGYADTNWSTLYDVLKRKGFTDEEIEKAGLSVLGNRGHYDRFRGRIMFPLSNTIGRVVGFSGRLFDAPSKGEAAKYVNTPETPLYHKSSVLYGYDKAKRAMLQSNTAILVEGQVDLLMAHQAGTFNTVALSGTALTADHLQMIKRFSDSLIVALDGDDAGLNASERAFRLAISLGIDVKVARLPKDVDPADLIAKDKDEWNKVIKEAHHIVDFVLSSIRERKLDEPAFRREVGKRVIPYIAEISNKIDQAHFVGKVANELKVAEEHVWEEVKKLPNMPAIEDTIKGIEKPNISRRNKIRATIAGITSWQEGIKNPLIDPKTLRERYDALARTYDLMEIDLVPPEEKEKMILVFENNYNDEKKLSREVDELFINLELDCLEEKFERTMRKLKEMEEKGEIEKTGELFKECQEISKSINNLKNSRH